MASRRRRVVWTAVAREAIQEALEFIAEDSAEGARKVLHAALDLASGLETLGDRGRIVPEIRDPDIREVFVYSYRLLYRVKPGQITILGFLHGARDFERWRRKRR